MNIVHCEQGDATWLDARTARVTASEVADVLAVLRRAGKDGRKAGDPAGARQAYMEAIVAEILTGQASEHYVSRAMKHGSAEEPFARAAYESRFKVMVEPVGFVIHPAILRSGASPDGLVDDQGCLEIKAPKTETHIRYVRAGILPPDYEPQVMWQLACTEREWCDFMSYDSRLKDVRYRIFRVRVNRDEQRIAEMENGVRGFLQEVDDTLGELQRLCPEIAVPEKKSRAVEEIDPELGITDADIPAWFREMA
jgi:hypothetical protein